MIADLERATTACGPRGYRYAHFEAGAIGQRLYIAAEALGLRATGIGAFFDDEVHRYLGLNPAGGRQVIYHFAVGYPVDDPRLEG
jgi:nitroreductase